jgi:AcrR family transcriptional regulator
VRPPVVKRADAQRNRAAILAAAEAMFGADGLEVSVDEIARRAKVGIGTLYRHFPTKDALVGAIVVARIAQIAEHAEQRLLDDDAGAGLFALLTRMVEEGVKKRDFVAALGGSAWLESAMVTATKQRFRKALAKLLARAQEQRHVREDVQPADLTALVRGVLSAGDAKAQARLLAIVRDGLAATD